ncbi:putative palmitoyltransferase [Cryptosporidium felis]|nr:putative palmitoyltransferase [Cryptosporidium felis]
MELSKRSNCYEADYTANELAIAAQRRDKNTLHNIIQQLIETGNSAILNESNALHWSVYYRWDDVSFHLLNLGCDPFMGDINGDTAIHYCIKSGNFSMLKHLHEKYGNKIFYVKNRNQFGLMLTAASEVAEGKIQDLLRVMEWLYLQGYSLEEQDILGQTPLFWATKRGNCGIIQWLISHGANTTHRDHKGNTLLHAGCSGDVDEETMSFLCDLGLIHLLSCSNYENQAVGNTAFQICWTRRNYWLALMLNLWYYHNKLFGRISLLRNPYAVYYWFISLLNLLVVFIMVSTLKLYREFLDEVDLSSFFIWFLMFATAQLFWVLSNIGNMNYVRFPIYQKHIYKLSRDKLSQLKSYGLFLPLLTPSASKMNTNSSIYNLMLKESEQVQLNNQLIDMNRQVFNGEHFNISKYKENYNKHISRQIELSNEIIGLMPFVSKERQSAHSKIYIDIVEGKPINSTAPIPPKICVTCRTERPFRSHHCSDCGYCIQRFDHHCVWIDSCVGYGNQRSFFFFLNFLTGSFLLYYHLFQLYCSLRFQFSASLKKVSPNVGNNNWFGLQTGDIFLGAGDSEGILFHEKAYYFMTSDPWFALIMFNSVMNIPWMVFVLYLFVRHVKSILTNVTFYEYYKKPEAIKKRFSGHKMEGFCFDMQGRTFSTCIRSIFAYFTKNNSWDTFDFFTNVRIRQPEKIMGASSLSIPIESNVPYQSLSHIPPNGNPAELNENGNPAQGILISQVSEGHSFQPVKPNFPSNSSGYYQVNPYNSYHYGNN